ncbi:MAG: hypothetical protein WCI45_11975, partial [Desulfuromonadales bacterium]
MMKTQIVILSLLVLVECSHALPARVEPGITSGADADLFLSAFRVDTNHASQVLSKALWSASTENGTLSEWGPPGGGEYNSN